MNVRARPVNQIKQDTPQVRVKRIVIPVQAATGDDRVRLLVIDCPFCGREHSHGGGTLSEDVRLYYTTAPASLMSVPE